MRPPRHLRKTLATNGIFFLVAVVFIAAFTLLSLRETHLLSRGQEPAAIPKAASLSGNLGILSDSTSDEYRANDNRAGGTQYAATTLNWAELLVKYRGINLGAWGDRAEPRRSGYEYNWSRTGAVVADLNSTGAATGLASQIRAGLINVVVVQIGANDFSIYTNQGRRDGYDICNGLFTSAQIQQKNTLFIAELTKTFDTLRTAGNVPVVVASVPDTTLSPTHGGQCTQAQKLKDAIASLNAQIRSLTTQRGYVFYDLNLLAQTLASATDAQGKLTIGGVKIDFLNNGNAPTFVVLADGIHPGTIYSGLLANEVLKPINKAMGSAIPLFTDGELLVAAGITTAPPTPTPLPPTPTPVPPLPAVSLTSPGNGSTTVVVLRPQFEWTALPGATNYGIQISKAANFTSTALVVNTWINSTDPRYTPTVDLPKGVPLYWRIITRFGTPVGPWSSAFSFTSANPPSAPVLVAPNSLLLQTNTATLSWKAATPAPQKYQIEISTNPAATFTTAIVGRQETTGLSVTSAVLPRGKVYYWRVRAISTRNEESPWSAVWSFKIAPDAPILQTPANNSTSVLSLTPTFEWSDSQGATNYTIQISRNSTFTSLVLNTAVGSATSSYTATVALPKAIQLWWRVIPVSTVGNGLPSATFTFTSPNPPTAPVLTGPVSNALLTTLTPVFTWKASTPVPGRYELEISTQTAAAFPTAVVARQTNIPGTSLTHTMTTNIQNGQVYYWRMRAVSAKGEQGPWSAILPFRTPFTATRLVSPQTGSTTTSLRPTFDWDDVRGATHYRIQVSTVSTFATLNGMNVLVPTNSFYTHTADLKPQTSYFVRIQAYSAVIGYGPFSPIYTFTTPVAPPTIPVPTTPVNGSLGTNTPSLGWKASTPIPANYKVEISTKTGVDFGSGIVRGQTLPGTQVTYVPPALGDGITYYWRVRAVNAQGIQSAWSTIVSFKTKPRKTVRFVNMSVSATPNNSYDGFALDSITEDGVITEDTSSRFQYVQRGDWPHWNPANNGQYWTGYSGGSAMITRFAGDYVEFTTTATTLTLRYRKSSNFGKIDSYINGVKKATYSMSASSGDVMTTVNVAL